MTKEDKKLYEVLQALYAKRESHIRVSPSWLATEAMVELDKDRISPELVYRAAHLHFRQIARSICRHKFEDHGELTEQHDLFPELQTRYPVARQSDAEPEYVLLEHVTQADFDYNCRRMESEITAKTAHLDAFRAWWYNKTMTGTK